MLGNIFGLYLENGKYDIMETIRVDIYTYMYVERIQWVILG